MIRSLTAALSLVAIAATALAGPELVRHPDGYATGFVRYHVLDKPDRKITRFFYIDPEALVAAEAGGLLPDGTVLVMEDHAVRMDGEEPVTDAGGAFIPTDEVKNVFVMEKREGWGAGYPDSVRNGTWEYARFDPAGALVSGDTAPCFECHKAQEAEDFTFTVEPFLKARGD